MKHVARQHVGAIDDRWLELVQSQVASMQYGVVEIVVHGGRVVQIDRTEKIRLNPIATPERSD